MIDLFRRESRGLGDEEPGADDEENTEAGENKARPGAQVPGIDVVHVWDGELRQPAGEGLGHDAEGQRLGAELEARDLGGDGEAHALDETRLEGDQDVPA